MPINPKGGGRSIKPRLKRSPKYPKGSGRSIKPRLPRRKIKSKIRRNRRRRIKGR